MPKPMLVPVLLGVVSLLGDLTLPDASTLVNNITGITSTGFAVWYAWYTATKWVPSLIKDFRQENDTERASNAQIVRERDDRFFNELQVVRDRYFAELTAMRQASAIELKDERTAHQQYVAELTRGHREDAQTFREGVHQVRNMSQSLVTKDALIQHLGGWPPRSSQPDPVPPTEQPPGSVPRNDTRPERNP